MGLGGDKMICPECGESFLPLSVNQKYCSTKCGDKYRRKHKIVSLSITFNCAKCGKAVVTEEGTKDMRTRFCSETCEKKYWRHPPHDCVSSRTNFHSLREYISWENRTND